MKVLFTQPVFIPNRSMLDRNVNSIKTIENIVYKNDENHTIDFILGGWAATDELWNEFMNEAKTLSIKPTITRTDQNYGKAYTINKLAQTIDQYDYMLTADSDILFKQIPNFLSRIINTAVKSRSIFNKEFGVLGLNQEGHNCHAVNALNKNAKYVSYSNITEMISYSDSGRGIAGGCIFTSSMAWKTIGGYRKFEGVYAGEDGAYLNDIRRANRSSFLLNTISVIHPHHDDEQYARWKLNSCINHSRQIKDHQNSSYLDMIKNSESFWKNKK